MKKEKSCGNIVFKEIENKLYVLLVHHNLGHWGIPKGHVEINEKEEETAVREVFEETGINSYVIPGFRKIITYSPKDDVLKDVVFFIGKASDDNLTPQLTEVSEAKYVEINEGINLITHIDEKQVLKKAFDYYQEKIR